MKHPTWRFIILAILIFLALNQAYLRASPRIKNILARQMNAVVAAAIIQTLTPAEEVRADGGVLVGVRGRVDIKNGCEGFEVILILAAIILAYPLGWRMKVAGLLLGSLVLYAVNLGRIVSLFYISAIRPEWFDPAHTLVWQIIMILLAVAIFLGCIQLDRRTSGARKRTDIPPPA